MNTFQLEQQVLNRPIHKLFEAQVLKSPNNIALVYNGKKVTYSELNHKANQIAHYLTEQRGLKQQELVCLMPRP